uniref:Uncharacterized protein n=1 Tax=Petromyzon marinus TaxID=7757 RepID=S4RER5_PETMA
DRLLQSELLVSQLRAAVQERDSLLQQKETQLQEEAKTHEAKMSKVKLQARAKLSARMENSRRLKSSDSSDEPALLCAMLCQAECRASDRGSVKRGKLLLLRHRVAELEAALAKEQQKQQQQQDLQHQVQALQEALSEKDELIQSRMCIIEVREMLTGHRHKLSNRNKGKGGFGGSQAYTHKDKKLLRVQLLQDQLGEISAAVGSEGDPLGLRQSNNQLRQKVRISQGSLRLDGARSHREGTFFSFRHMVLALETALQHREERHRQEVFTLTARNDAAEDFQQACRWTLKQNLHEKEEVLAARTHVVEILQAELDQRDATIVDLQESGRRALEQQRLSLSHQEAEKLMLTVCLQNSNDQQVQPNDPCDCHPASGEGVISTELLQPCPPSLEQEALLERIQELEEVHGRTQIWTNSHMDTCSYLDTHTHTPMQSGSAVELPSLRSRVSELEEELSRYTHVHAHNEELASRLHVFEQLERVMQLDLEQAVLHNSAKWHQDGEKDVHRVISQDSVVSGTMEEREVSRRSKKQLLVITAILSRIFLKGDLWDSLQKTVGGGINSICNYAATREARSLQSKRVSPLGEGESLADLWDDYSVDHAACCNINAEWHHSPGLRSVVGDLELERNQLQQQIQELEEQLEEMDTRQSLQIRTNRLQAEVERLKSQLSQLRNEKSQDEESHHSTMSNLCDRISVLVEENARLEGALQEKERALNSESAHAARFQATEASLAEAVAALSTLSAKLSTAETQVIEAAVKRRASEAECSELRVAVDDRNKQLALKTTKLQLLEEQENSARAESEHLAEELERLNLSFMEERAHLIATLQEKEREIVTMQTEYLGKEREISMLKTECAFKEQDIGILKAKHQDKEEEIVMMHMKHQDMEQEIMMLR